MKNKAVKERKISKNEALVWKEQPFGKPKRRAGFLPPDRIVEIAPAALMETHRKGQVTKQVELLGFEVQHLSAFLRRPEKCVICQTRKVEKRVIYCERCYRRGLKNESIPRIVWRK